MLRRDRPRLRRLSPLAALALVPALGLAACGSEEPGRAAPMSVAVTFYPLEFVTSRVAGDRADVVNLTRPGAEPHDLELTPGDVATLTAVDLVVYLPGFQPAVDDSVGQVEDRALDVTESARLLASSNEGEDVGEDGHGRRDPHFWLDPTRLADVADAVADRLAALDPDAGSTYAANAERLRTELETLDADLTAGLADCSRRTIVTGHESFGYLAERYRLEQVGIAGLNPEAEPGAAALADVADFVRANGVTTIYYETLVSSDVAKTVATETGAATAVLDPIEGLTSQSAGQDYVAVMRSNLETLRRGQSCS
jgi:zinc transport system substrate-binding protein